MLVISQTPDTAALNDKIKKLEVENHDLRKEIAQLKAENKRLASSYENKNTPITNQDTYGCSGTAKCISEKVIRIVDGDTIYTTNYKIRLALTNTPEKNEPGYSEATTFTARICPVGSLAVIDQDDYQLYDAYGRMLAIVYCDGKSLNAELLYNGHAEILTEYCDSSEFSSEMWAQKFGCGTNPVTVRPSEPVKSPQSTTTNCEPSYPDFCIPPPPPDLDCKDIAQKRFTILPPDPHRFDGDKDGIGCES